MSYKKAIAVILLLVLILVQFSISSYKKPVHAAGYFIAGREVPGPLPPNVYAPWMPREYQTNIVYGSPGGYNLLCDFTKPTICSDQKIPLIIFVHGGWWVGGSKGTVIHSFYAKMYLQLGFAFAAINYRRSGIADHPETINDCKLAVRYFRANANLYGIDPERVGVFGISAGGHLVSLMGTAGDDGGLEGPGYEEYSSRPQAVVDYCGIEDLTQPWSSTANYMMNLFLGCYPADCPDKAIEASPVYQASPDDPPILKVHGDRDTVVAYTQALALADALYQVGNKGAFISVTNGAHSVVVPQYPYTWISPTRDWIWFITVAHMARFLEPGLMCDLNLDGTVDQTDLAMLVARLGHRGFGPNSTPAPDNWNPMADIYLDDVINYKDLQSFCISCDPFISISKKLVSENGRRKTFNITVANTGPLDIANLVITDTFPKELKLISISPDGARDGNRVTVNWPRLDAHSELVVTVVLEIPAGLKTPETGHTFRNDVTMTSDDTLPISADVEFYTAGMSLSHRADKFTAFDGDVVKYKMIAKNPSRKPLTNCKIGYQFPRELEFIKTNPAVASGSGNFVYAIGNMNPGDTYVFDVWFRVSPKGIGSASQTLQTIATLSADELNSITEHAAISLRKEQEPSPLQMDISWNGFDSKTSMVKTGDKVTLTITPSGGTSPYEISVNWNDGKSSFQVADGLPVSFEHVFKSAGEYVVAINCKDFVSRATVVRRKVTVE